MTCHCHRAHPPPNNARVRVGHATRIWRPCFARVPPVRLQHLGDRWNAEFITNSLPDEAVQADISYGNEALEDVGGSWNTLGHRRVHSAPNIMERMGELSGPASSRWGESGSPMPPSDVRKTSIHDHVIPEGRRYQVIFLILNGMGSHSYQCQQA